MMKQIRFLKFLPFALLLALPLMLYGAAIAEPEVPVDAVATNWSNLVKLTNVPNGAQRPVIAVAPNGKRLLVAFLRLGNGADVDPYYIVSNDNGATWENIQIIKNTTTTARQVHVVYDASNRAHAVWIEHDDTDPNPLAPFSLLYARENRWGGTTPNPLTIDSAPIIMDTPRMVASGTTRLDLVWAQFDDGTGNVNIFHARSTNANTNNPSWSTPKVVRNTAPESKSPDVAVSANGQIHVVWEEQNPNNTTLYRIRYSRSNNGGNTWSTPINISNSSIPDPVDARRPRVIADGNTVHVTFTDSESTNSQFVHHLHCAGACHLLTNWQSDNQVSGGQLAIHQTDPAEVSSAVTQQGNCTLVYFHGINTSLNADTEIIWGVNSCDNWSKRLRLTGPGARSIKPNMGTHGNWWVYLAFERITGNTSQIWFVRSQPALYLPFVVRN